MLLHLHPESVCDVPVVKYVLSPLAIVNSIPASFLQEILEYLITDNLHSMLELGQIMHVLLSEKLWPENISKASSSSDMMWF